MKLRYLIIIISLLALGLFSSPAQADGEVTVCDEAHFLAALSGGGLVTFSCSGTIYLSSVLTIDVDTVIDAGGQNVTLAPDGNHQVLNTAANITLRNITIADGYGGPYTSGAGISNSGTLLLDGATVANNGAGSGGGIVNGGQLTINNSTIRDNLALSAGTGFGGHGAGIFNSGDVLITNSTFEGNYANTGGAIYNLSGTIEIVNSTFYQNQALPGDGGAISNLEEGTINIINTTFSMNEAGQYSDGSGIDNSDGGSVTLTNSIVAYSVNGDNCKGPVTDGGGNLSYPDATCPGINLDPVLGPLQDNGGPTLTAALLDGSSAVDNAIDTVCNNAPVNGLDQRGVARPIGDGCDIGSVESDATPPQPDFVMQIDPLGAAMCLGDPPVDFEVDLLSVAGFNDTVDLTVINVPDGAGAVFDNTSVNPPATSQLTISDDGIPGVGRYTLDVVGTAESISSTHSVSATLYLYDTVPDVPPTLLTPADGQMDVSWTPHFAWEPVPGAIYYDLEVATDINFTNLVYTQTVLGETDTPYEWLATDTVHYWRVKARNSCGETPYSAVSSFTTVGDTIPPTFVFDSDPTQVWTCPQNDAVYDLTLYGITDFDDEVTLSVNGLPEGATSTFDVNPVTPSAISIMTISDLEADTFQEYSLEVVGTSAAQTKSYYVFLNLRAGAPDSEAVMLSPTDGATNMPMTPFFDWEGVTGAQWYMLEVATDTDFTNVVYRASILQTSHQKPTPLDDDTNYYWRITPMNNCGAGQPSSPYTFKTESGGSPPPAPDYMLYMPVTMMEEN